MSERDDLYGLPPDRFVPERDALAKALRADGRRDEAREVAKARKPSVAAWAVNRLVRTEERAVKRLFGTGDALRDAQAELLAGRGDARTLRAAGEDEREAVEALLEVAGGLLAGQGHEPSSALLDRVAGTLHAAALDENARGLVREGRLERELRHAGLGLGEEAAAAPAGTKGAGGAKEAEERERVARERAEAREAEREHAAARKAAKRAESRARKRADRARIALQAAEERRERAAAALGEADEALAAAREAATAAADEHERAQADLEVAR